MQDPARIDRIEAIALGTSAGGVEALSALLPALPRTLKPSLLIVVHLPREKPSLLTEIFRAKCPLPVVEARDKQPVEPGTVYFAPPDYHLLVDAGPRLALSADDLVNYSRPSIDVLFESAADVYRSRMMGVVLTGSNRDGAAGLRAIRAAGGITVVQDPATAMAASMPAAALAEGSPDYVLDLDGIGRLLHSITEGKAR